MTITTFMSPSGLVGARAGVLSTGSEGMGQHGGREMFEHS